MRPAGFSRGPRRDHPSASRALALALALALVGCFTPPAAEEDAQPGAPVRYKAIEFTTEKGVFTAILYESEAPKTVAFMERLVGRGYYDGREFGRVIPGFVIQEVDRAGGATDQPERVPPEFGTRARFSAGALGIARSADPNSGGSEFFVMDFAAAHLDGNYTAFGQVIEGLDVVHAIARVEAVNVPAPPVPPPVDVPAGPTDRPPLQPVKMTKVVMTEVTLDAAEAAQYPLMTGEPVRIANGRASLEWTRDVAAGRDRPLTWYLFNRAPPDPDLTGATVTIVSLDDPSIAPQTPAITPDPVDGRALHFDWTPPAAGRYNATLTNATGLVAWATIEAGR